MNPELNRLSDLLNESVDRGEYAGASVMVLHKGEEIYYAESGYADVESGRKISRDTIFRIYSQSKPITGTAAVMNIDRGVLSPRAMVARFLPGFANQRYDTEFGQGLAIVSDRPMYVADLLNMTSGIPYPWYEREGGEMTTKLWQKVDESIRSGKSMSWAMRPTVRPRNL